MELGVEATCSNFKSSDLFNPDTFRRTSDMKELKATWLTKPQSGQVCIFTLIHSFVHSYNNYLFVFHYTKCEKKDGIKKCIVALEGLLSG